MTKFVCQSVSIAFGYVIMNVTADSNITEIKSTIAIMIWFLLNMTQACNSHVNMYKILTIDTFVQREW